MRRVLLACSFLAAGWMAGCGSDPSPVRDGTIEPTTTVASVPIVETTGFDQRLTPDGELRYVVTSVEGAELASDGDLVLTLRDGVIGVSGGCNGIGGADALDGEVLVIDQVVRTAMACAEPVEAARPDRPLEGPTWWEVTVEVHADRLRLIGADSELELQVGDEPLGHELDGRVFETTAVQGRDLVAGTSIRLEFSASAVRFWAGCNTNFAPYRLIDGILVTAPLASTAGGCQQDLYDQDAWINAFLASRPTVTLDDTTLTITDNGVAITLTDADPVSPPPDPSVTATNAETEPDSTETD